MKKYRTWLVFICSALFLALFSHEQENTPETLQLQAVPILVVGGAMCDFFLELDYANKAPQNKPGFIQFEEGKKIPLKHLACHTGGGGLNATWALKKLGCAVNFISSIGTDANGNHIIQHLENAGITTKYIQRNTTHYTGTSFILPSPAGNNTILMSRGASQHLNLSTEQIDAYVKDIAGFYLAPLSGESIKNIFPLLKKAYDSKVPILWNPSSYQVENSEHFLSLLQYVTILLVNETEAAAIAKLFNLSCINTEEQIKLAHKIQSLGPKICLITNGAKGSFCASKESVLHQHPCSVTQKKSVGAGDTFGATFFGALINGFSIAQSLLFGTLNSASILSHATPHEGLLSLAELKNQCTNLITPPPCYEIA